MLAFWKILRVLYGCPLIETNILMWSDNQITGFYMRGLHNFLRHHKVPWKKFWPSFFNIRDRRQIALLILREFKRINQLLFPLETFGFLIISEGMEVNEIV